MKHGLVLFIVLISANPLLAAGFHAQGVTTCVSPDSSLEVLTDFLGGAGSSLYINTYTFTSYGIAESVVDAKRRGADVMVMVEKSPVGGISEEERVVLNHFLENGISVFLSDDPVWRFNHGKYAVADNLTVFVSTENLGRGGYPEEGISGNRGWCIELEDPVLAEEFSSLFFMDLENARRLERPYPITKVPGGPRFRAYSPYFKGSDYEGSFKVVPILAPENALEGIVELINSANRSVLAEQFYAYAYWGDRKTGSPEETPNLFLQALINAARRGCEVKLLLDDTWYNVERDDPRSNYYTVRYLNDLAKKEGLDLEARLMDSEEAGLTKLHAKGVVVDRQAVLVSSVNWNEHSPTKNREVGVIVYGEPAEYYARVFETDWSGRSPEDRQAVIAVVVAAALSLVYLARRRHGPS